MNLIMMIYKLLMRKVFYQECLKKIERAEKSEEGKFKHLTFEERISIGEVLGDAENYATVTEAIGGLLKNLPAQRLYIISKTDIIISYITVNYKHFFQNILR